MINLDTDALEELEARLVPLLKRRGIKVESIQPIGVLGRGASSTVFSLLINHEYFVLKLYYSHASFLNESRNRRRLIWPPKILLTSRRNENSLGYDLVITEVPEGVSFNSDHLLDWVQDRLGNHLLELHRLRRRSRVTVASLRQALADCRDGALQAAHEYGEGYPEVVERIIHDMGVFLKTHSAIMRVERALLHNDLWWDNIIIAHDHVYLVDWESMRVGDYLEDLAFMRVMLDFRPNYNRARRFWQVPRDELVSNRFFAGIIELYRRESDDPTLNERFRFYLALQTLRRLSDIASHRFTPDRELSGIWLGQLDAFWRVGLTVDEPEEV